MADKKIITVFGATGAQGGGLVDAILTDKESEFSVRAVTRNANSDKAQRLKDKGVEVVEADVADIESVKSAMRGAYGAYCVTFFWEHMSTEKEDTEAKNMAEAAKAENLTHVVWSTLDDTRKKVPLDDDRMPTLSGKYKVPHFDVKGAADHYFTDAGVPTTFLLTTFYWDNLIYFGMGPKKGEDGKYVLNLPMADKKLAGIASGDIGKCAYGIFKKGLSTVGQTIGISGDAVTGEEMAAVLSKELGKEISYNAVPFEAYRNLGFPGADDLGNMFQFYAEFESDFVKSRDVEKARALNPALQDFPTWVHNNATRIPME